MRKKKMRKNMMKKMMKKNIEDDICIYIIFLLVLIIRTKCEKLNIERV
jgi:hypothetical protein